MNPFFFLPILIIALDLAGGIFMSLASAQRQIGKKQPRYKIRAGSAGGELKVAIAYLFCFVACGMFL